MRCQCAAFPSDTSVAALVDTALFERSRAMQERFDALCDRIAKGYENVPLDEGIAEIELACDLARQQTAEEWRSAGRLPALATAPAPDASPPRRRAARPSKQAAQSKPARRGSAS